MAANGVGVPTSITLTGAGVGGTKPNYTVTLAVNGTVVITAAVKDAAGDDPSYAGSVTWTSYNAGPTGGAGKVATVSAGTITAVAVGQALVEAAVPSFDKDGANAIGAGKVYSLILVTVTP